MQATMMDIQEKINAGISYEQYRTLVNDLLEKGESTGPKQSESLLRYSQLNTHRMNRLDKSAKLLPEVETLLKQNKRQQTWLVLSEGWCGDAAQVLPIMAKMADTSDAIDLRIVLRDEHLELMDNYLTNGGRSIPKLVVLEGDNHEEQGTFGPRPSALQAMVLANKNDPNSVPYDEFAKTIQQWYNRDKGVSIQREILQAARLI